MKTQLMTLLVATLGVSVAFAGPKEVSAKISEQLLSSKPAWYKPTGCSTDRPSYGQGKMMYCVVATWVNALECARTSGNKDLEKRLIDFYENEVACKSNVWPKADSVDNSLFGALPLEISLLKGKKNGAKDLALGLGYAKAQWEQPLSDVLRNWAMPEEAEQKKLVADGYSTQTRFWIDDMYMITALQIAAYRASGDKKYLDRAAHQMRLYAEKLQREDGLFPHTRDVTTVWGRGAGWMAGGLTLLLKELPHNHPDRVALFEVMERFVEGLERWQRPNGLWGQIVDDPSSWDETSSSAMFAYMMMTGATREWIAGAAYAAKARKTFETLAKMVDANGNVASVCEGTNASKNRDDYLKRPRVNGAPYGQAAMLLLCQATMEEDARYSRKKRKTWKGIGGQATFVERANAARAAETGTLKLESTYESISVAYGAPVGVRDVELSYRKAGETKWLAALKPLWFKPARQIRGSIVNLSEDTEYDVRVATKEGKELAVGKVRTWKTEVPVAKTIEIDTESATFPIVISEKGTDAGWIRYVPKDPSKTLVNKTKSDTIKFSGAHNVIVENFRISGGKSTEAVHLSDSDGIRIRNCEIFGCGPAGRSVWGKQRGYCFEDGVGDQSGAIVLDHKVKNVTIERCVIHSPRGRAHSWRYSHPYGPSAIQYRNPDGGLVIRYNDFIASDTRRWEDAVKCRGNGGYDTGPNRNADIYGNFFFAANDDGIELDGGQQNVRCFRNRFEESLMGCSIQFNQTSPSYVYENLFSGLGTEFGHMISAVKTASIDGFHQGSASFVFNNTAFGPANPQNGAIDMTSNQYTARLDVRNNLLLGPGNQLIPLSAPETRGHEEGDFVSNDTASYVTDADAADAMPKKTVACKPIPNFLDGANPVCGAIQPGGAYDTLPYRPIPWKLSSGRVGNISVKGGAVTPASTSFKATCAKGSGYRQAFRVIKTVRDSDWYEVSPMEGVIEDGKEVSFTIAYDAAKMMGRRTHAAAFVVRAADGYSRPFSIHATTDRVEPFECPSEGVTSVYGKREGNVWMFDLPEHKGEWYVLVHARSDKASRGFGGCKETAIETKLDAGDKPAAQLDVRTWWTWALYTPGDYRIRGLELKAGSHTIEIVKQADGLEIDGMVMTTDPGPFEPEGANGAKVME